MAALPTENTARFFVDYATDSQNHTLVCRSNGIVSPAAFGANLDTLLTALTSLFNLITINTIRFAAQGSTFSFPVISGVEGNTYGTGSVGSDNAPRQMNFIGRSSGGKRCRVGIFGYKGAISSWRLTDAESAPVGNAINHLNASVGLWLAIDGIEPVWYPYANTLFNAYWTRNVRA
jgi:hypothetical protein